MDLERDYIEYVAEFSLALLAISAAYFLEPGRPVTYLALMLVPALFGYTAYISRDGFSKSSLLALIALLFAPLGFLLGGVALVISIGNILVSVFAGGNYFRDYYGATTVPLLLVGLLIGTSVYLAASNNPTTAENIRTTAGDFIGENAENIAENADLIEGQKQVQLEMVEQTSRATVLATEGYILNETQTELSTAEQQAVINAFNTAEQEVPSKVREQADQQVNTTGIDISETTSSLIESNMKGDALLLIIPVAAVSLYSLQPLIGLLTAIFAYIFSRIEGR